MQRCCKNAATIIEEKEGFILGKTQFDSHFFSRCILDLLGACDAIGVVMMPGLDESVTFGEVQDLGRILRVELSFEPGLVNFMVQDFVTLARSLYEIGLWYHDTKNRYGTEVDANELNNTKTLEVWEKYVADYLDYSTEEDGILRFCEDHGITGQAPDLLAILSYKFCGLVSLGAPDFLCTFAARKLAEAYLINGYSVKAERIDTLMEETDNRSYFAKRKELDEDDAGRIFRFINTADDTVIGPKAKTFLWISRCNKTQYKMQHCARSCGRHVA